MTLAKGFLKAIAKDSDSPAEILCKMNELFYENVERGRFISMIYAILDMENKIMKIARAGHNPVLLNQHSSEITLVTPKGLALGLEKGIIFRQVISEDIIKLEKGSTFIFYTDGFTEAVNSKGEEFGLHRIQNILEKYSYETSENLLEILKSEVKNFIGRTNQYDDMTMIIIKVS
jgi:sigma-B regulation protein RsbU (phosphoserine phosphatase)